MIELLIVFFAALIVGAVVFYAMKGNQNGGSAQTRREDGERWLAEKEKEKGVHKLPSGLMFKVLRHGTGAKSPGPRDPCQVHYEGTLKEGKKFDSSYDRGSPATFAPFQVIKGWTEALQLMREGDKWEVYIPFYLGYGSSGAGGAIPGYAPLIFKMELIKVMSGGKPASEAISELEKKLGKSVSDL
jgi:FKBP-type peptidyl-prolyl cis-trans isomerase FklB